MIRMSDVSDDANIILIETPQTAYYMINYILYISVIDILIKVGLAIFFYINTFCSSNHIIFIKLFYETVKFVTNVVYLHYIRQQHIYVVLTLLRYYLYEYPI